MKKYQPDNHQENIILFTCFFSTVNNITGMNSDTSIVYGLARPDVWRPLGVGVAYVPAITGLVLPAMMGRHKGAVVNVCSPAPTLSLSRFHVYTAAKVCGVHAV